MSLRILGFLLLVVLVLALRTPLTSAAGQGTQASDEPVWQYHVVNVDSRTCNSEEAMAATLNANGRQGWELVGYQAGPLQMPDAVDGSILMRPAATGAGKDVSPQLADSFKGEISLRMAQPRQLPACRLVFKREATAGRP